MIYHTGPALGLSPKARFAQNRFTFEDDDRLLLYTDGLYDAPQGVEAMTADQIRSFLADDASSGQRLLDALLSEARGRRGEARQEDDITMVLLTARAGSSSLDNGKPTPITFTDSVPLPAKVAVLIGRTDRRTTISIQGRGTWEYCGAFHDAIVEQLAADWPITIDMSLCPYLDSTFLGTLQEVTARADRAGAALRIQGVLPEVERLLEELGMDQVIEHIAPGMLPLPSEMHPVGSSTADDDRSRRRILSAHESLAALSASNREEFAQVIEYVRGELAINP